MILLLWLYCYVISYPKAYSGARMGYCGILWGWNSVKTEDKVHVKKGKPPPSISRSCGKWQMTSGVERASQFPLLPSLYWNYIEQAVLTVFLRSISLAHFPHSVLHFISTTTLEWAERDWMTILDDPKLPCGFCDRAGLLTWVSLVLVLCSNHGITLAAFKQTLRNKQQ